MVASSEEANRYCHSIMLKELNCVMPTVIGFLNGVDQLALTYGSPDSTTVGLVPFTRGVWHQVTVRIGWSRGAKGRADGSR